MSDSKEIVDTIAELLGLKVNYYKECSEDGCSRQAVMMQLSPNSWTGHGKCAVHMYQGAMDMGRKLRRKYDELVLRGQSS